MAINSTWTKHKVYSKLERGITDKEISTFDKTRNSRIKIAEDSFALNIITEDNSLIMSFKIIILLRSCFEPAIGALLLAYNKLYYQ